MVFAIDQAFEDYKIEGRFLVLFNFKEPTYKNSMDVISVKSMPIEQKQQASVGIAKNKNMLMVFHKTVSLRKNYLY